MFDVDKIAPQVEWGTPFMEILRKMFENAECRELAKIGAESKRPQTWDVVPPPCQYLHLPDEEVGMLMVIATLLTKQWCSKKRHSGGMSAWKSLRKIRFWKTPPSASDIEPRNRSRFSTICSCASARSIRAMTLNSTLKCSGASFKSLRT
jgi:hypothetical protein